MKLIFDHVNGFGKMAKESLLYYPAAAILDPHEYVWGLENGWFPLNKNMWFQSRSTRIDLTKYKTPKHIVKRAKKVSWHLWKPDVRILTPIYEKYISHKEFSPNGLTIEDIVSNSDQILAYRYENKLVAFLAFKIIKNAFLSIEFAWDYSEPDLSLGHISRHAESIIARAKNCRYLYMSMGYETCSLYKANYLGFQWWTGYEWSEDINLYKKLCELDSRVEIRYFENRHGE